MMSYTLKADSSHRGGKSLQEAKASLLEAIDAGAALLAGSDFTNVRIEGQGSTVTGAVIRDMKQALDAARS